MNFKYECKFEFLKNHWPTNIGLVENDNRYISKITIPLCSGIVLHILGTVECKYLEYRLFPISFFSYLVLCISCNSELVGGCVRLNLFTCILQYLYGTLRYIDT